MDIKHIQKLIKIMDAHGLLEVEIEDKDGRIRLKKNAHGTIIREEAPSARAAAAPAPAAHSAPAAADDAPDGIDHICSPLVGTFYRRPNPDGEPYVKVGDHVEEDTVVCVVEAMKVMNEIKAEKKGTVRKVLVEDAHAVEYMQPIFEIEPD